MISVHDDSPFRIAVDFDFGQKISFQAQNFFPIFSARRLSPKVTAIEDNLTARARDPAAMQRNKLREFHLFARLMQILAIFAIFSAAIQKIDTDKAADYHLFFCHLFIILYHRDALTEDRFRRVFCLDIQIFTDMQGITSSLRDVGHFDFFPPRLNLFSVDAFKKRRIAVDILADAECQKNLDAIFSLVNDHVLDFFDMNLQLQRGFRRQRDMALFLKRHSRLHRNHGFRTLLFFRKIERLQFDFTGETQGILSLLYGPETAVRRARRSVNQQNSREIRLGIRHQDVLFDGNHRFGLLADVGELYLGIDGLFADGRDDALLHFLCRHHRVLRNFLFVGHSFSPFQIWSCYNLFQNASAYAL